MKSRVDELVKAVKGGKVPASEHKGRVQAVLADIDKESDLPVAQAEYLRGLSLSVLEPLDPAVRMLLLAHQDQPQQPCT